MGTSPDESETADDELRPEYDFRSMRGWCAASTRRDIASDYGWCGWPTTWQTRLPTKRRLTTPCGRTYVPTPRNLARRNYRLQPSGGSGQS